MKYFVFIVAALGVPPLSFLLHINRRWMKYAFWGMIAAMALYHSTSINFFSDEFYRGSSRGMEISLVYLFSFAVLGAFLIRHKLRAWIPEWGLRFYVIYFLLCLPSLIEADDLLISWYEIWKMIMLYFFYLSVYTYLTVTDDVKTVLKGLAAFAIGNLAMIAKDHLLGVYQPHGFFPHQNAMAVGIMLFASLFFAGYIFNGIRGKFGKMCLMAFACSAVAIMRSYSRVAMLLLPFALGLVSFNCICLGKAKRWVPKLVPIAAVGALGVLVMLPRIIERFVNAPESSKNTRIELALCAREMIRDEPWTGVGINNWGIKINPPYDYAERAGRETNRGSEFKDGIVETVYLLVCAECGVPALLGLVAWFGWYWISCVRLMKQLKGTQWFFIPAGFIGGFIVTCLQSCFEWVYRQQLNLICLMFMFALISYLNKNWQKLVKSRSHHTLRWLQ